MKGELGLEYKLCADLCTIELDTHLVKSAIAEVPKFNMAFYQPNQVESLPLEMYPF
jgi:hypothetical protein